MNLKLSSVSNRFLKFFIIYLIINFNSLTQKTNFIFNEFHINSDKNYFLQTKESIQYWSESDRRYPCI